MPTASGSTGVGSSASPEATPEPASEFPWAVAAQAVALVSLLLPFVGVVVRWISFRTDHRIDRGLSVASPVPELAYVGFWAVLPALLIGAVLILVFRLFGPDIQTLRSIDALRVQRESKLADVNRRLVDVSARNQQLADRSDAIDAAAGEEATLQELSEIGDEHAKLSRELVELSELVDDIKATDHSLDKAFGGFPSSRVLRIGSRLYARPLAKLLDRLPHHDQIWMPVLVGFTPLILLAVFVDDVSQLPALVGAGVASFIFTEQTFSSPRLTIGVAVWPLALLLVTSALSSGLSGRIPSDALSVSLAGQQLGAPTWSARIAESNGITYFLPCQPSLPVIGVRTDDIKSLTYPTPIPEARPDVTLWSVIANGGHATFGYQGRCP